MPWRGVFTRKCSRGSSASPSVGQPTGKGEGASSRGKNAQKPGYRLQMSSGRSIRALRVPPAKNPACAAFEEYGEVPETVPLNFTEDDVTWVASKLSGTAGALVAEAIELHSWLLRFGCASDEFRVAVASLAVLSKL